MKMYAHYGINDFIICLGYRGYVIKEYFANYFLHNSDVTIDARENKVHYHQTTAEPWRITLIDTGEQTMTGGRLRRVARYLDPDEAFCFTYGDGLADVDIGALLKFHAGHGKRATLTAVAPPGRYGALSLDGNEVRAFVEKPPGDNSLINGGFFVLHPSVIDLIAGDATSWEAEPLQALSATGDLMAWRHKGYWQAMDTLREKNALEALWQSGKAPWKTWK